jgi:hypothetical protein
VETPPKKLHKGHPNSTRGSCFLSSSPLSPLRATNKTRPLQHKSVIGDGRSQTISNVRHLARGEEQRRPHAPRTKHRATVNYLASVPITENCVNPRERRNLHNDELHNLYSSPDISQVKANEMSTACGTHGRGQKSVQGFGGKARRKESTLKTKA